MIFDPFGDFESRGYLQNFQGLKNPDLIKRAEHRSFQDNLADAIDNLRHVKTMTYQDVLDTHAILFADIYPWAGHDRSMTAPNQRISKAGIEFALPGYERAGVEYALNLAQEQGAMAQKPGEVIGYLAYAHPFLDGNGRTVIVVANELAYRAGIGIDWSKTNKEAYLTALADEINDPHQGRLDAYLAPYIVPAISHDRTTQVVSHLRGLGPIEAEPGREIDDQEQDYSL